MEALQSWLQGRPWAATAAGLLVLVLLSWAGDRLSRGVMLKLAIRLSQRTKNKWDDALIERGTFNHLAHVVPASVFQVGIVLVPGIPPSVSATVRNIAAAFMVLMGVRATIAALSASNDVYQRLPIAKTRPIKGYIQLIQLVIALLGGIVMISILVERSPWFLLSGLGAMTAVLLLIFKDTVLSFVASIQLMSNDMIRVGDWIEIPQAEADGDVIDIALHTITIQNWDKTIVRVPTYRFSSEPFKNWRGMQESGGRRIKRAILLDISSVRFLSDEEVEHFRRFALLREYIDQKLVELKEANDRLEEIHPDQVNRRRLTNLGTFRAYAQRYLKNHPNIHQDMPLMVRQLDPLPQGIPLELYCFTRTVVWAEYEGIRSDLFDHLFAILPEFGLRAYQQPSGADLARLAPLAARSLRHHERLPLRGRQQPRLAPHQRVLRLGQRDPREVVLLRQVHQYHGARTVLAEEAGVLVVGPQQRARLVVGEVPPGRRDALPEEIRVGPVEEHADVVVRLDEQGIAAAEMIDQPRRHLPQIGHQRHPAPSPREHQAHLRRVVGQGGRLHQDVPDLERLPRAEHRRPGGALERPGGGLREVHPGVELPGQSGVVPGVIAVGVGDDDGVEPGGQRRHRTHPDPGVHQDRRALGLVEGGVPLAPARQDRHPHRPGVARIGAQAAHDIDHGPSPEENPPTPA
jgi:miniconductance mechanosensitive channel